ncbi:MAG: alcohol dehydrogenase catalytic domain-containing protein [Hyphomicrobiales bacterium]|nr:alcohol dehydrogenase catalytic domain-containing protein [Hyphomicrobiales bacterium]
MTSMKAVTFANFGAPSVLEATVLERPVPGPDEVLVRIHAAGVCYHDVLSRGGKIPGSQPGRVLGHEIAGEIVETGANVPAARKGERVVIYQRLYCGTCRYCLGGRQDLCRNSRVLGESGGGGYAEFTCAPARNAIVMPDGLAMTTAALAVCPVGTSVRAALGVAAVEPGQTVLITGAGGGLGLHQIQVVKSVNGRVIAVTSSEDKAAILRQAGADEVIVSPDLTFSAEVWKRTGKQGVDVVLENVVSDTFAESLRSTAQHAIVVVLGNIAARRVEIDPGLVIARRIRIAGSGNATYKDVRIALHLLATGAVKPFIGAVLPFPRVGEGHAMMERRAVVGRVVLSGW